VIETPYQYKATVVRWIDGDTCELTVDLGFHLTYTDHFRLYGINTPERGRPGAAAATARANELAPVGATVLATTSKSDKYGRWLTLVNIESGLEVNTTLVAEGLAGIYFGGTRAP
jgi:micrococcal nuclease